MKNKAEDLKNALFEQLEKLSDPDLDLDTEIKRTKAMVDVGQVLVNLTKEEISFQKMKFNYGDDFAGKFFENKETKQIG